MIFARTCFVMAIGFGMFLVYYCIAELRKSNLSNSWPSVPGVLKIERGEYRVNISYTYSVDSKEYLSDRVIYGDFGNKTRSADWKRFSNLNDGDYITVYYMPGKPWESALVAGRVSEKINGLAFLGIGFVLMGSLWIAILHFFGKRFV